MALLVDGQINGLQDLQRYEASLLSVTGIEQIDVNAKMALAQDLISAELFTFLMKQVSRDPWCAGLYFDTNAGRRQKGVSDVVATDELKRWHALRSVELIYMDAYNNQLNDRYKGKWAQYQKLAEAAAAQLLDAGIGLVADPIRKADTPILFGVAGALMGAVYYARVAWMNGTRQEGALSDVASLRNVDGMQLVVSATKPPANAAGWNVYVGAAPEDVSLQNPTPLAVGSDWTLPVTGLRNGQPPGTGQRPERYVVNRHEFQRG